MNIYYRIPYYYKWNNHSNVRSLAEELARRGYGITFSNKQTEAYAPDGHDLVMLHGTGAIINKEQQKNTKVPVMAFGWSDPNLYQEDFYDCCSMYFTNDLLTADKLSVRSDKPSMYFPTACNKVFHKDLWLAKETDVLVYGTGNHKFIPERNALVNYIRSRGIRVKVFGKGWNMHEDTHPFIDGQELIKEINKAHLCLDITTEQSSWAHRILECSACGTPVLTMDREDTRQMFIAHFEILLYRDYGEIISLLQASLVNKESLRNVGIKAQKRCYRDHDITVRVDSLIKHIDRLGGKR